MGSYGMCLASLIPVHGVGPVAMPHTDIKLLFFREMPHTGNERLLKQTFYSVGCEAVWHGSSGRPSRASGGASPWFYGRSRVFSISVKSPYTTCQGLVMCHQ